MLYGRIPHELGKLEHLTYLDLYTNKLTSTIPAQLATPSLRSLYLGDNMLNGTIPDSIYNLELEELNLGINRLSGTISSFSSKYLQCLYLQVNFLTRTLPQNLNQAASL